MTEQQVPGSGHEGSDVNVRAVVAFGLGLIVVLLLLSLGVLGAYELLLARESAEKEADSPLLQKELADHPTPLDRLPAMGVPGDPVLREPRLEGIDPDSSKVPGPPPDWPGIPLRSGVAKWPSNAQELDRRDRALLDSYGWVDRDKEVARIPIDRAIELTAGKLPVRTPSATGKGGKP
jgi:hypothetical protein